LASFSISNAGGPLRVSTRNPRYLVDAMDRPVYLSGMHTWYNIQDGGASSPPAAFDWNEFLTRMVSKGHNFTRLWTREGAKWWPDDNTQYFHPPRYIRTGPGTANDGLAKFDLTKLNPAWIDRLRARVADCSKHGIYCAIMLFDGFSVSDKSGTYNPATHHPYMLENNINSLDGDADNDGMLLETQTDLNNNAWTYQLALVDALIDALNQFDNVIWETCNEPTGSANQNDWCNNLVSHIRSYEASKAKQHPIWYSVAYPTGSNGNLDASDADCVSYNADKADTVVAGTKVSIYDTDHTVGGTSEIAWIWTSLCEGHGGAADMDTWASFGDTRNDPAWEMERANLGYALIRVNACRDFLGMTPQAALCSTGFCLARDHATAAEYICFQDGTGNFTLNLATATGTLDILWLRCSDGATSTGTVSGGAIRTLTPPWSGMVVAHVRH
jgi:hypothetical protein